MLVSCGQFLNKLVSLAKAYNTNERYIYHISGTFLPFSRFRQSLAQLYTSAQLSVAPQIQLAVYIGTFRGRQGKRRTLQQARLLLGGA